MKPKTCVDPAAPVSYAARSHLRESAFICGFNYRVPAQTDGICVGNEGGWNNAPWGDLFHPSPHFLIGVNRSESVDRPSVVSTTLEPWKIAGA